MGINEKFTGITRADIEAMVDRYGLRMQVGPCIDRVRDALLRWPEFAAEAKVSKPEVVAIARDIAKFSKPLERKRNG